jgi:Fic family protein
LLRKTREYDRLWDELEREVARRGLPEQAISALAEAAIAGRLTSSQYRSAAGVSAHAANRDLKRLVDAGLLVATSDERGRCYVAADPVKAIRARTNDPDTLAPDPFAT